MKEMSLEQLEKLWHCSRKLALTNYERHQTINLQHGSLAGASGHMKVFSISIWLHIFTGEPMGICLT